MTALMIAVVTFVIFFMTINVCAQIIFLFANFINSALSLTNMIRRTVTIHLMIQFFLTKSLTLSTLFLAILNFLRIDLEHILQLKQILIYRLLEITILRQLVSQIADYKSCSLL